jgi:phenylacetate-coenzyme A ligase PaaK-like adenylate-forming protein
MSVSSDRVGTTLVDDALASFVPTMQAHFDRLSWDATRLRGHQDDALRDLVHTAIRWSPFHRERLGGVDPTSVDVDALAGLPVMTKADLVEHFDDVMTDRRLTRARVERHLATIGEEPALLLDEYLVLASGGSSGVRGIYVMPRDTVLDYVCTILRTGMAGLARQFGWPLPFRLRVAMVMAPLAIHATRASSSVASAIGDITHAPATLPFDEIVARVRRAEPMLLAGYPSVIARLAREVLDGRLRISPSMVIVTSEQLVDRDRDLITAAFGIPPVNSFGSSERLNGTVPPGDDAFTFASDRAYIEFVDEHDRRVESGTRAHHILVTNLTNHVQPLIRYRLDDTMTQLPPAADHGHQRANVHGRDDEMMRVGDQVVHPLAVRSAILHHSGVREFQAVTGHTADGRARVELRVVASGPVDLDQLANDVAAALDAAGADADVTAAVTDLDRNSASGKTRRFVNL